VIVAGVLSGTSLDGIDVAVVDVGPTTREVLTFATLPFDADLRARIVAAFPPAQLDARTFGALHADIGDAFGAAVARVAAGYRIALVGSHGVTLAHDGGACRTLQIGDAFRIRERTHATVAFDFRAADCAAGGHGAPLVPYLDALLFGDARTDRVALNLGGIANLTIIPAGGAPGEVVAFDSGPANLPIDTYIALRGLGDGRCDRDGELALAGQVDRALLAGWLADPYFAAAPPKTAGRETYGRRDPDGAERGDRWSGDSAACGSHRHGDRERRRRPQCGADGRYPRGAAACDGRDERRAGYRSGCEGSRALRGARL
jgi:anhydro-N-acetylmuramic acid kinase